MNANLPNEGVSLVEKCKKYSSKETDNLKRNLWERLDFSLKQYCA